MAAFAAIAGLMIWDLAVDYRDGVGWLHIAVELLVLVIATLGALLLWLKFRRTRTDLSRARSDADRWRRENDQLLRGFSAAIADEFRRWELSDAETEIGFYLLKGLSHREIAGLRDTSERTVREQSRALYRKAGLSGRAELSAFFLEDLMLPATGDGDGRSEPAQVPQNVRNTRSAGAGGAA